VSAAELQKDICTKSHHSLPCMMQYRVICHGAATSAPFAGAEYLLAISVDGCHCQLRCMGYSKDSAHIGIFVSTRSVTTAVPVDVHACVRSCIACVSLVCIYAQVLRIYWGKMMSFVLGGIGVSRFQGRQHVIWKM
jgi:hypothetical protein